MKFASHLFLAIPAVVNALKVQNLPVERVKVLLIDMRGRIESDGKKEQQSYDKYACWCESTLARKAGNITTGKENSKALQTKIIKLEGELGSHGAEIKQLEKDIAANLESQRDARSVRDKDRADYEGEKTESENCIGALDAAIKVLTGAGEKSGFLQTMREVELLSVVSGLRSALKSPASTRTLSGKDLELIHRFIEHPVDFVGSRGGIMSAVQIANNPFGDYAPQSTQIQGILKGMYDAFQADMKKDIAEEAESQKAYGSLIGTKKRELGTLQATLEAQQSDNAKKTLSKATSNQMLDDTKEQLAADEELFDETESGCKEKAGQWSIRSRLRSEELAGVGKAIVILTNPENMKIFTSSSATFVQLASVSHNAGGLRLSASSHLAHLAQQFHSYSLAKMALEVKSSGHFDKVIASIDQMIASLREEEQSDIEHRDRCQKSQNRNENELEDLGDLISKAGGSIKRMESEAEDLNTKIGTLEGDISNTKTQMLQILKMRNEDVDNFKQAMKDDTDAVALLERTIVALTKFYKDNHISMSLIVKQEPNPDKAPETSWADEKYGGRNDETHGVVAIIEMIKEDVEKEMKTSREDNAAAEAQYEKEKGALQDTMDAQLALKRTTEKELGDVQDRTADKEEFKDAKTKDKGAEENLSKDISYDCAWVATHFESRRTKRKTEIDGLVDAKGYLAGAEAGSLI